MKQTKKCHFQLKSWNQIVEFSGIQNPLKKCIWRENRSMHCDSLGLKALTTCAGRKACRVQPREHCFHIILPLNSMTERERLDHRDLIVVCAHGTCGAKDEEWCTPTGFTELCACWLLVLQALEYWCERWELGIVRTDEGWELSVDSLTSARAWVHIPPRVQQLF